MASSTCDPCCNVYLWANSKQTYGQAKIQILCRLLEALSAPDTEDKCSPCCSPNIWAQSNATQQEAELVLLCKLLAAFGG